MLTNSLTSTFTAVTALLLTLNVLIWIDQHRKAVPVCCAEAQRRGVEPLPMLRSCLQAYCQAEAVAKPAGTGGTTRKVNCSVWASSPRSIRELQQQQVLCALAHSTDQTSKASVAEQPERWVRLQCLGSALAASHLCALPCCKHTSQHNVVVFANACAHAPSAYVAASVHFLAYAGSAMPLISVCLLRQSCHADSLRQARSVAGPGGCGTRFCQRPTDLRGKHTDQAG